MDRSDQVLFWLLWFAVAAFPVAAVLYLRTAYRKGGRREVKAAAVAAAFALMCAILIPLGLRAWGEWEVDHFQRVIEHPFAFGSILFVVLMWLAHRVFKAWMGETYDHD